MPEFHCDDLRKLPCPPQPRRDYPWDCPPENRNVPVVICPPATPPTATPVSIADMVSITVSAKGESDCSGREAEYFPITAKVGGKVYEYQTTRDRAYNGQRKMHAAGLAPQAYEAFEFTVKKEKLELTPDYQWKTVMVDVKLYGYTTESVTCVAGNTNKRNASGADFYAQSVEVRDRFDDALKAIKGKIMSVAPRFADWHAGNFGWTSEGKLVLIDCAECVEDTKDKDAGNW